MTINYKKCFLNYIRQDTLHTINALFASLSRKPYCTFFSTASTQSLSGKILNFTSIYSFSDKEFVHLSLQDILIGIISPECPLLIKLFPIDGQTTSMGLQKILNTSKLCWVYNQILNRKIYLHKKQHFRSI